MATRPRELGGHHALTPIEPVDRVVRGAHGLGEHERALRVLDRRCEAAQEVVLPGRLRDDLAALRSTALRARAAYGPKDSVRDVLPADVTEPFLDAIDRLLREINRAAARG